MSRQSIEQLAASILNGFERRQPHVCRKCAARITDREYIDSGLFLSLCPACLASARQTIRQMTAS